MTCKYFNQKTGMCNEADYIAALYDCEPTDLCPVNGKIDGTCCEAQADMGVNAREIMEMRRRNTDSEKITAVRDVLHRIVAEDGREEMERIIDAVRPGADGHGRESEFVDSYEFDGMDTLATYLLRIIDG